MMTELTDKLTELLLDAFPIAIATVLFGLLGLALIAIIDVGIWLVRIGMMGVGK